MVETTRQCFKEDYLFLLKEITDGQVSPL